jgi:hypothetical protein
VLGKAATLNGDIGDVLIADFVHDEHTANTYSFDNAFAYLDVAPLLERGSVLDNQRAVTVKGTFLQNREYLDLFYRRELHRGRDGGRTVSGRAIRDHARQPLSARRSYPFPQPANRYRLHPLRIGYAVHARAYTRQSQSVI